jgi:hypothetical protein
LHVSLRASNPLISSIRAILDLKTLREIKLRPAPFGSVKFNPFKTLCVLGTSHCRALVAKQTTPCRHSRFLDLCWCSSHCVRVRGKIGCVVFSFARDSYFISLITLSLARLCVVVELETVKASDNAINLHLRVSV